MSEDKEREVFAINLTWPQSQRDKWEKLIAEAMKQEAEDYERKVKNEKEKEKATVDDEDEPKTPITTTPSRQKIEKRLAPTPSAEVRKSLSERDANASSRLGNFKTPNVASFHAALPWRYSTDK